MTHNIIVMVILTRRRDKRRRRYSMPNRHHKCHCFYSNRQRKMVMLLTQELIMINGWEEVCKLARIWSTLNCRPQGALCHHATSKSERYSSSTRTSLSMTRGHWCLDLVKKLSLLVDNLDTPREVAISMCMDNMKLYTYITDCTGIFLLLAMAIAKSMKYLE